MPKISVLFKPYRSWISSDLTYLWYYEYSYKDIYNIDLTFSKKIKIDWVPQDDIWDLYDYLRKNAWEKTIIIIMCNISSLFDN